MELPDLNLTVQLVAFRTLALLIVASIQGGVIAATAVALGDKGPRYDGRLTLMPGGHIDTLGAIGVILFGIGWTRPVDIDPGTFRVGRIGAVVVVLAGVGSLLGTAALLDALVLPALATFEQTAALATAAFLRSAGSIAIWVALLGLVPLPPLTGGLLLAAVGIRISPRARSVLAFGLLLAVATGVARQVLTPAHDILTAALLGD